MLAGGLVDLPTLLTSVLYCFDPTELRLASVTKWKTHESNASKQVPNEAVYGEQFATVLRRTLATMPEWRLEVEAESEQDDGKKLDLLLVRQGIDGQRPFRVGLEFVASSAPKTIRRHASRLYPQTLRLDQYVIVHFSSHETKTDPPYFCEGIDKDGNPCDIPVYHIYHDEEFTKADIVYKPTPGGAKIRERLLL